MIWFALLNVCGVEKGLQEAERQANKEAMTPVQVQDDVGVTRSEKSLMILSKETERPRWEWE